MRSNEIRTRSNENDDRFGDPSVRWYMQYALQEPLISIEEEKALSERIRCGDRAAFEHMLKANLRLVVKIASKYPICGIVSFSDLISAGNSGLMKAIDRYNPKKAKFSTYAGYWIRQRISLELAKNYTTIAIPVLRGQNTRKIKKTIEELTVELGRDPTLDEVAERSDLDPDTVESLIKNTQSFLSLDYRVCNDGAPLSDVIEDKNVVRPDEYQRKIDDVENAASLVKKLSHRDRQIIERRFGLNGFQVMTLEEIGREMCLTRERIRQIQEEALQRLGVLMGVRKRKYGVYKTDRKKRQSKKEVVCVNT